MITDVGALRRASAARVTPLRGFCDSRHVREALGNRVSLDYPSTRGSVMRKWRFSLDKSDPRNHLDTTILYHTLILKRWVAGFV